MNCPFPNKVRMSLVLMGHVEHKTKVTRMPGIGYGCRVFVNGFLNQEIQVPTRLYIGPAIREMLRMEDKCGNISQMAHKSRMRPGIKDNRRKAQTNDNVHQRS